MISEGKRYMEEAVEAASLYSQAELDHFKLRMAKAITLWSAKLIAGFVMLLCVVLVLIFFGLAAGMYLQTFMDPALAYLLVGITYALFGIAFIALRKKLLAPVILRNTLEEMFDEA